MKKIKSIILSLICLLSLSSCSSDGLNRYRNNGQLIDLDYQTFDQKLIQDDSFIFFLKRNGCHSCNQFYEELDEFLKENKDAKIYSLNHSEIEAIDAFTVSSYFVSTLGKNYYVNNGYSQTTLYTPSIAKIVNGEFVYASIGVMNKEELSYVYQDNYLSLDDYYSYNRKVQNKETFNLFISKNGDAQYDLMLREYFINNPSSSGMYLNSKEFTESENERLLNRINYYLGEENKIESLPDYCLLQYEKGEIKNCEFVKYDENSLNSLYGNK